MPVKPLDQLLALVLDVGEELLHGLLEPLLLAVLRVNPRHGGEAAMEGEERTGEGPIDVLLADGGLKLTLHVRQGRPHLVGVCRGLLPLSLVGGHGLLGTGGRGAGLVERCLLRLS